MKILYTNKRKEFISMKLGVFYRKSLFFKYIISYKIIKINLQKEDDK